MSDDITVENQSLVQPDQSSDTQQSGVIQDPQPQQAPQPDIASAFEARLAAEAEKRRALEDELRRMQSVVLERALAPAPVPQAVPAADPWASLASNYDPATVQAMRAAVEATQAQALAQRDAEMRQLRAELARTSLASQAQAYGPEVAALAQAAFDSEVRQGRNPDVGVVTRWALGEAIVSGKYKPGAAPQPAAPAAPRVQYAPPNPVVNGAPLPPKRTGLPANFDQLSRSEQVQAVESLGDTDFSIF